MIKPDAEDRLAISPYHDHQLVTGKCRLMSQSEPTETPTLRDRLRKMGTKVLREDGKLTPSEALAALEALQESEEKYRSLFDGIGDAIFLHNLDANIVDVNAESCKRYGYTKEQFLEMKVN